jgi:NADH dehydrogenase
MKTLEDARHLRSQILSAFEMAELATTPDDRAAYLTFVVIDAGPTGVELVGQVAELAHDVLPRDYRLIDTHEAIILLVEAAPTVLGPFHSDLQRYTRDTLEKTGVQVLCNTAAVGMDDESITIRGPRGEDRIPARTKIWAAGVRASPLAKILAEATGSDLDRAGRVSVLPDCSLRGHPEVFAIGDMAALNKLPGVAQPAIQEGRYVGRLIRARLAGRASSVAPFQYRDKGSMATIGRSKAVADALGVRFTGMAAYAMWGAIHVLYLIGWGNRLGTLYTWLRSLTISKNRGYRIITQANAQHELHRRVDQ